jgi:hypothetical protein
MDLDQLVSQIAERTGISPDLARTGVQMVGGFVKDKLPGGASGQIESLLGTQTVSTPQLAQASTLDEIAGAIAQHTGIPTAAAKTVVEMAGNFLADKIPAPFGDQVKSLLGISGQPGGGIMDQAKNMLGGMFGHHDQ